MTGPHAGRPPRHHVPHRAAPITLDSAPNSDAPREVVWDGDALYDTMTLADVLEVMTETDPTWDNEHDWQRVKIVALQDYAAANSKRFLWALGGHSDLTKTIQDDQVDALVVQLVQLLALGGADGVDFDWEHLSQYRDSDPDLHAQQRVVVGKVIVALKAALVEAGMEDMWICYTPRYNAFFPTTGSTYGQNNIMTDGEGIDIFDYVAANSAYGVDAVDYVHLMMYDLDATTAFADATESYFVQAHYDAVVQSHVDYGIPLEKIVMGFEPGPQAYTGVWGGLDHDKATIDALHAAGIGGVMFWVGRRRFNILSFSRVRNRRDVGHERPEDRRRRQRQRRDRRRELRRARELRRGALKTPAMTPRVHLP